MSSRGLAYYESGKPAEALADWTVAAVAGDAFSQYRLGVLYMMGILGRLPRDPKFGTQSPPGARPKYNANDPSAQLGGLVRDSTRAPKLRLRLLTTPDGAYRADVPRPPIGPFSPRI